MQQPEHSEKAINENKDVSRRKETSGKQHAEKTYSPRKGQHRERKEALRR